MSDLVHDVRTAFRGLRKRAGSSAVAIVTLALGIGATTAIYTVVSSVLLEPLPYPEPERLVVVQEKNPEAGFPLFSISPLNFRDYRAMSDSFESMAASTGTTFALTPADGGAPRQLAGRQVTHDYLRVYGVAPLYGRDFGEADDRPGAPPVAIVNHRLWQELGGDRALVGQTILVEGQPTTVVGVLPPGLFPQHDLYAPLRHDYEDSSRGAHWLIGIGRLADGVTVEAARADLERVSAALAAEYPDSNTGWSAVVDPLRERVVENVATALWVILGAVGVVLLIACANVANLTLADLARRERDVATRSALGAGRGRLVRQMLVESLTLATVAGALGIALAVKGTEVLVAMNVDDIPRADEIAVDGGVLLFALGLSVATAIVFGLVPALHASRPDLAATLREGGRGSAGGQRGDRLRRGLVIAEVALAVLVTIGAGLLVKSYDRLTSVDPGFDPGALWTATFSLPGATYDEEGQRAFHQRLLGEVAALPGVESAGTVVPMPLSGDNFVLSTYLEGEPPPEPNQERHSNVRVVGGDYFAAMAIPVLRGRAVGAGDRPDGVPVAVVNRAAAEALWGDESPLGRRFTFNDPTDEDAEWIEVVGVVGDVHHDSLAEAPSVEVYLPVTQSPVDFGTLVARTGGDPLALASGVREAVRRIDPYLPLAREQTGGDLVAQSTADPRFNATLLGSFAVLALVLATIGVFGVMSYTVAQRLRDLGVRIALGAGAWQVAGHVLRQGLRPVAWGLALGLAAALAATRALESLVYDVPPRDPATFLAVALVIAGVAALAALLPTLRATRVDPVRVLRDE